MISPQRFSKSLGNNKLKIGLSLKELFLCSVLPSAADFMGFEPFIAFMIFLGAVATLAVKNKLLEPSFIKNTINKKTHIDWERIEIND